MRSKNAFFFCAFFILFTKLICQENWVWAQGAGGPYTDVGEAIAVDNQGNQYVTGYYNGTATFGSTTLIGNGGYDVFVAKLDVNGNWLWVKKAGGGGYDWGTGIAIDSDMNVYVIGRFTYTAYFGTINLTSSGGDDIFVAKLDTNGNWIWARRAGGDDDDPDIPLSIALDSSNNIYVSGTFYGISSFGSTSLTTSGYGDIFIAKLNSNGNWLWAKRAGGSATDVSYGLAVNDDDIVYVTGGFRGVADFGSTVLVSNGSRDIFCSKLDSNGNWLWTIQAGGPSSGWDSEGRCITIDGEGNAYITGTFGGTIYFDSITLVSSGAIDLFCAKLDSNGNWLWARQAGGAGHDRGYSITLDSNSNIFITGNCGSLAAFGSIVLVDGGGYVAKLDSAGNWIWSIHADCTGTSIDLDDAANIYITGNFGGIATFGPTSLTSYGWSDVFIGRMSRPQLSLFVPNGGEVWRSSIAMTIYWYSDQSFEMNVFFSYNNGDSWVYLNTTPIDSAVGYFSFIVPAVPSSQCLIKVESVNYPNLNDISNSNFTITTSNSPSICLVTPDGPGLKLQAGRAYDISWVTYLVSSVDLDISYDGGMTWTGIAQGLPANQGFYAWTAPAEIHSGCYLRVTDSANAANYDWSDQPFTIAALELLSPNGGELAMTNSNLDISWTSGNVDNVKLEYSSDNGAAWNMITASLPADLGTFAWTVPATGSAEYLVRVSDAAAASVCDQSDGTFAVVLLDLTYPSQSGIKLQAGDVSQITWTQASVPQPLKLEFSSNGGSSFSLIADNIDPTLGSYAWAVPDVNTTAGRIRVSMLGYPNAFDISSSNFTIAKLVLTAPNGLETWASGTTRNITWTQYNLGSVKLEYSLDAGTSWTIITASTGAAAGSYNWTVPAAFSENCLVRISDPANPAIDDHSDAVFTIRPQLLLEAPNGGEYLTIYGIYSIHWSATIEVSSILIDYSINGGSTWQAIQSTPQPASVGIYDWFVPNTPSTDALIRVRDYSNSSVFDVSDAVFTITTEVVAQPKPPEGVQIAMNGNDAIISWEAVTQTVLNTPVVPDYYEVYCSTTGPDEGFTLLGTTTGLQYTHASAGTNNQRVFYRVVAIKEY